MDGRWRKARLRWRPPLMLMVMVVVVWSCVGVHGASRARLVNNGYEGVVVGVSSNVEEKDGPVLMEKLKTALKEASWGLFLATERRAYFRSVTILIPRSWTTVNVTHQAGSENYESLDILVDEEHPVYRNQPYTGQNGGCGDPGLFIHLTPPYLLDDSQALNWGSRGTALLLEWAKLRWGVFDELGYPNDSRYPLFYTDSKRRISPTHCAHPRVRGQFMNQNGNDKYGATTDGRPEDFYRFIPDINPTTTSSLLSYPFIMSKKVVHFCAAAGRKHNAEAPTKQNAMCNKRSAWDVISEHPDFMNGSNPPTEEFKDVTIRIIQQADTTYALVLDYSGSMAGGRITELRRTARRWLLHEVATGSSVAIINFSSSARLVRGVTKITNEASRKDLANAIGTNANGGTSIGAGLQMAVKTVLVNRPNPVILLITDGEENTNPLIKDVLNDVVTSSTRVVTVAFGAAADPKLETVAKDTGGKTFTVMDSNKGQMLNDAFQGALTFQPPPSAGEQIVQIVDENYQVGGNEVSHTFNVDSTVGRNLILRLEASAQVTSAPVLTGPDGYNYTGTSSDSSTWMFTVALAKKGEWRWKMSVSGQQSSSVKARVTIKSRDPSVQPIITRAWASQGAKDVNAVVDKVVIFAEVKQGHKPVVGADVRAIVTPPNEQDPSETYTLLDNGQGADTMAGDGIYSRYMTKYPSTGRYSVKAQVTDGGTALLNNGFHTSRRRRRREAENNTEENVEKMDESYIDFFLRRPDVCCGSVIPLPEDAPATGSFERTAVGGSIKVTTVPKEDVFAPARVRDLQVQLLAVMPDSLHTNASISITWTAPGDDMDSGLVSGYELRMTTNRSDLLEENFIIKDTSDSNSSSWQVVDLSGLSVDVEGGKQVLLNLSLIFTSPTTYFALRAWDDVGIVSNVSNTAVLYLDVGHAEAVGMMPTWAVVLVVLAGLCLVCLVVIVTKLCLAKRKTQETERLL